MSDPAVEIAFPSVYHFGFEDFFRKIDQEYLLKDLFEMNRIPSSAMFRRSRWLAMGGYLESLRQGMEDYEFWVRLLRDGGAARPVPTAYLHYRSREDSRLQTSGSNALTITHESIVASNPEHHEALLSAALQRLREMHDLHLEYRSYVHKWQSRMRPLIRARDVVRALTSRRPTI